MIVKKLTFYLYTFNCVLVYLCVPPWSSRYRVIARVQSLLGGDRGRRCGGQEIVKVRVNKVTFRGQWGHRSVVITPGTEWARSGVAGGEETAEGGREGKAGRGRERRGEI